MHASGLRHDPPSLRSLSRMDMDRDMELEEHDLDTIDFTLSDPPSQHFTSHPIPTCLLPCRCAPPSWARLSLCDQVLSKGAI
ncbi:hypothetical protein FJTKL_12124 [Diaporthe vaccinii]|uniref:Uncharacterized protein n=1 Tax=Diaporthe vaccinii TaxID=105482 RepID=A0ABR4EF37_9PEZI